MVIHGVVCILLGHIIETYPYVIPLT